MVAEDKMLLCPLPVPPKKLGNLGWGGHLSSIPLMLPLQIPCSLVYAKLISNSCAPSPLPRPESEKLKREPQSLGCCRAGPVIGLGVNEKVQANQYAHFFLRCGLPCFSSIYFFQILSPPSTPLTRALLFVWTLNIGLTQTCIATDVPPPNWEPNQSSKRTTRKCKIIVRNKAFESRRGPRGGGTLIFLHM